MPGNVKYCPCKGSWTENKMMKRIYVRRWKIGSGEKKVQSWHPIGWICPACRNVLLDETEI